MTDYRSVLEHDLRLAGPAGFSMDDLARRRNRKGRNQRLGTAGLALILAAAAIGLVVRAFDVDRAPRPAGLPTTPNAWSRYELQDMRTSTITTGGPGLIAVGWDERGAAVWTSPDGQTWTRAPAEELGRGTINDVTPGGPGFVAVGTTDNELARIAGTQASGPSHTVVWTSPDGVTWTRLPDDRAFRRSGLSPSAVAAGGPGVVAVGANEAWFSPNGITWNRAAVPPAPSDVYPGDDGKHPQIYMTDIVSSGDRLVAVGTALLKGGGPPPEYETWASVMWTSVDGTSWEVVPLDPEVFPREGTIHGLTHGPSGFVAVGSDGDRPAVWSSADGLAWRRVSSEAFASRVNLPGRSSATWSVAASERGYVAAGVDGACVEPIEIECRSAEAAIWTSTNGESWLRVPTGDVFRVSRAEPASEGSSAYRVTPWGSRFVVEGEYNGRDAIWISHGSG